MHSPLSAEIIFSSHTIRNKVCQLEMKVHQIKLISLVAELTVRTNKCQSVKPWLSKAQAQKVLAVKKLDD